ncbi:aldo-keto reductase [Clavulina sp. PMI_390]|nr:aldo-keto reductase [Clavulina sp. PMI_390]
MATSKLSIESKIKMSDGKFIPHIGLGVYEMTDAEAYQAVKWALEAGYRMIDTAAWYENEDPCCRAIADFVKESGVPRAEIFYVTKLQYNEGTLPTRRKIAASLEIAKAHGLEYIDLYLVHGPPGGPQMRKESWEEVVRAHKAGEGLVSIGVSNFGPRHMEEIRTAWGEAGNGKEEWLGAKPVVNQVDVHPFMTRVDVDTYSKKHDVVLQAWAPLVRALRFDHPVVKKVAEAHGKSPAQVLLRWSVQRGYAPIPKSVSQKRILSNIDIFDFEITESEMAELYTLNENLLTDWDVIDCP